MTSIVIIDKIKEMRELKCKKLEIKDLYKKCNFRKDSNFDKRTEWVVYYKDEKYIIQLYAKSEGQANSENKYDFPPPIDKNLYFGSCCLIRRDDDNNIISLSVKTWEKLSEILFGGFDDIKDETESEDELEKLQDKYKTKDGYLKKSFIIEDDSEDDGINSGDIENENSSDNSEKIDYISDTEIINYKNKTKYKKEDKEKEIMRI